VVDWGLTVVDCLTTGLLACLFWALDCLILTGLTGGSATGLPTGFFATGVGLAVLAVGLGVGLGVGLLTKEAATGLATGLLATGLTAAGFAACLGDDLGVGLTTGFFAAATVGLALFSCCCCVFCVRQVCYMGFSSVN
jgi:hypothetical protein